MKKKVFEPGINILIGALCGNITVLLGLAAFTSPQRSTEQAVRLAAMTAFSSAIVAPLVGWIVGQDHAQVKRKEFIAMGMAATSALWWYLAYRYG